MATISKRGTSYRIRVSDGYDVHGKQIMRSMTWTPEPGMSSKQIEKELNRQAVLFEESGTVSANIKFEAFAEQFFKECVDGGKLKELTRRGYRIAAPRAYQALGHLRLDKITQRHLQLFVNNLQEDGINLTTGKSLSAKTVRNHLSFVSSVLGYAVSLGMIPDNPCRNIKIAKTPPKDRDYYSLDEAQEFLSLLEGESLIRQAFFTLAIFSGFRKGEMLGLQWKDINFETRIITIRRELAYTKEKGNFVDTPKTSSALRSLKLPENVFQILKQHQIEQIENRLKLGDKWVGGDWIFTAEDGRPISNTSMYNWLARFCQRNGLRPSCIHAMRHLNASLLINGGADIKTVSSLLGHAQASTTLNIYAYEFSKAQAEASEALASALNMNKKA